MKHIKAEFDKLSFKELFIYSLSVVTLAAGMVAIFISLFIPPEGEIHASVLTFFGTSLIFCGSLLGIDAFHKNKLEDFQREIRESLHHPNLQQPQQQ